MIDDLGLAAEPGRRPGARRRRRDVVRDLREGMADRVPVPLRGVPSAVLAVPWRAAVVALVLAVVIGTALLSGRAAPSSAVQDVPRRSPLASARPSGAAGAAPPQASVAAASRLGPGGSGPAGQAGPGEVVVHVVGRVRRPGLVRLAPGSRVFDAVAGAGGATEGARLDRLNLARPVGDGEQIVVPGLNDPVAVPGAGGSVASAAGGPGGAGAAGAPGSPIDLNSATTGDLDALPGVGPVLAGRIVAWRTEHGRFTRVAELGEVAGIGDKLLAQLTPLVRV